MAKQERSAISPTRSENFPEWYQQVVSAADLADTSPVRGCMIIKPWGYGIWENMQQVLDNAFKATGHQNAYFPLLIPMNHLQKEADHIDGFAKECAVVTHARLETQEGNLVPAGKLEEPYIIRPTSETIVGNAFAKWVQSYRDLPLLINQWANVMRWEMRTRVFLRTSEFLWQEGHTAHATAEEAITETRQMLDIYHDFAENTLALPVIKGEKTPEERFPGAMNTYTIEGLMQDGKALQLGTSHFLGQNFSRSFDITFTGKNGELEHAWTTSWGVSTRLIGGVIMTHSDDNGLVLPPRIAPIQIEILPIYKKESDKAEVLAYCQDLQTTLQAQYYHHRPLQVHIDDREINGGEKTWQHIKKGTPIRLEIGPRDVANQAVFMGRRDKTPKEKQSIEKNRFIETACALLDDIQQTLYQRAKNFRLSRTKTIDNLDDFKDYFSDKNPEPGFARVYSVIDPAVEKITKPLKITARCLPIENKDNEVCDKKTGRCIFTDQETDTVILFAKAY